MAYFPLDPSLYIKKHVGLVHCESRLSFLERKISNVLLLNAYDELSSQDKHKIALRDLMELCHYNSHDYTPIKLAILNLVRTTIEWDLLNDGDQQEWIMSTVIASAKLKNGVVEYTYSPHMKELLYNPSRYAKIFITDVIALKSKYSLNIYENCIRFANVGQTPWLTVETFKRLAGIVEGQYAQFRDINKRVITRAVEEINQKTQINIEAHYIKLGRSISRVKFLITAKTDKPLRQDIDISSLLTAKFSLSESFVKDMIDKFGEKKVKEKVEILCQGNSFKYGRIVKFGDYLLSILKSESKNGKLLQEPKFIEKSKPENQIKTDILSEKISKKIMEDPKLIKGIINSTSLEMLKHYLESTSIIEKGSELDFSCPRIVKSFTEFFHRDLPDLFPHLC